MAKVHEKSEFTFADAKLFVETTEFTPIFDIHGNDTLSMKIKSYDTKQAVSTFSLIIEEEVKRACQEKQKAINAMKEQNREPRMLARLAATLITAAIWAAALLGLFLIN